MEMLPTQHDIVSTAQPSSEQNISVDLQANRNSNVDILDSQRISVAPQESIIRRKKSISLKRWIWLKLYSSMLYWASAMFTSIVIIIGILIVCLTAQRKQNRTCSITYEVITSNINNQDSHPQFVAVGDLNNDTKLDIVVANTGINSVGVFLGHGNGTFASQTIYSTSPNSYPNSVALGDFNNDQCLDIAVANYGTHNIGIFLGYCNGNFTVQTTYSTGISQPIHVIVGYVNHDDYLDLIVANNGTNSVGVFLGYGNGTFANLIMYSTGFDSFPYSITVGDINGDKQLDIIVANYGTNNIGIHFGYGNGTFAEQMMYSIGMGSKPYSVAISDLNKDNKLDIVVANSGTGTIVIFLGYGNGSFADKKTFVTNTYGLLQIAVGDINYDNRQDIAITSSWDNSVYILLGYDNGTFDEKIAYSTNVDSSPRSIALGDFNNDNRTDVIVANYGTNNVGLLLGYDPAPFRNQTTYSTGNDSFPNSVTLGDVNNDNILDIIVASIIGTESVEVLLGFGDGNFGNLATYLTGPRSKPYMTVLGDFNNDNQTDIVVANSGTDNVGFFFGYGNGTFGTQVTLFTGSGLRWIDVGDFNSDSRIDLVVVNYNDDNMGLFLGYGDGSFADQTTFSTGQSSGPISIVVADFNNDKRQDTAVANFRTKTVGIFLGYGNGTFSAPTTYFTNSLPPLVIIVGDVNNDHHLDIIITTRNDFFNSVGLFLGNGDGTFETRMRYPSGVDSVPDWVAVGDLNNDNRQDIVVPNSDKDNIGIFLSHGDGTFASQKTYSSGKYSSPESVILGDLNKDGRLDIVVGNHHGNVGIFLGYSYGALTSPMTYSTGSGSKPQSVAIRDFNHDNQLDIAIANYGTNTISILLKYNNLTFANEVLYSTGSDSLPNSVILGDFNKDSEVDIVVVNFGNDNIGLFLGYANGTFGIETTYSTGSGSRPRAAAVGDFNNDNWQDIVVSNHGNDNVGVLRGFKYPNHGSQMIYSTGPNSSPNWIALGDLNNDNHLDIVVASPESENVGVFLGYENGTFGIQTIYFTGTGSQPVGATIADLNNDRRLDIIVAYYGLYSVGVFLGYGNGTFDSPIIFSIGNQSEPNAICVGDFNNDNRLDIVVVADSDTASVIVLLGHGDGTFVIQTNYSAGTHSQGLSVSVGDFNNDNQLDIVIANYNNNNIGVFLGYGNGTFADQMIYSTRDDFLPVSMAIGDLNNDNHLDVVVVSSDDKNVGWFLGNGNGTFKDQRTYLFPNDFDTRSTAVAVGDFNNDSQLDIVVTFRDHDNVALLLGYGNETFEITRLYFTGFSSEPQAIVIADLNHDNVLDIVVANSATGNIGVFLGYCCDAFLTQTTFSTGVNSGPQSVAVGHFNVDNFLDIAVTNELKDNIGILLGLGNGMFNMQTTYSTGIASRPYSVAIADFNNDTFLDIAVANYGNETVGVFFGYGNGTLGSYVTYSIGFRARPYAITILDFDNDNRLDIAVSNDGTNNVAILLGYGNGSFGGLIVYNTGYSSRPCAIAVGDFNKDTQTGIVVTECGSNNIGIISKRC